MIGRISLEISEGSIDGFNDYKIIVKSNLEK